MEHVHAPYSPPRRKESVYEALVNQYRQEEGKLPALRAASPKSPTLKKELIRIEAPQYEEPETDWLTKKESLSTVTAAALVVQMRRMEATVLAQSRTIAELRQQVDVIDSSRAIEAREAEPSTKAMFRVAARQENDEKRIEALNTTCNMLRSRIEGLETQAEGLADRGGRRLEALEARLNGVTDVQRVVKAQNETAEDLAVTTIALESQRHEYQDLRSDLDRTRTAAHIGAEAARQLRDETAKHTEEVRLEIAGEAHAARRAVAEEALARRDMGNILEERMHEEVYRIESRAGAALGQVHDRVDTVEDAIDDERKLRAEAVDQALDQLEKKWNTIRAVRDTDQETRATEADALRTALRLALSETERRVDAAETDIFREIHLVSDKLSRGIRIHSDKMHSFADKFSTKDAEFEKVLSAEIAARRSGQTKLNARIDAVGTQTQETLTALAKKITKLETQAKRAQDQVSAQAESQVEELRASFLARHEAFIKKTAHAHSMLRDTLAASEAAATALNFERERSAARRESDAIVRAQQTERRLDAALRDAERDANALRSHLERSCAMTKREAHASFSELEQHFQNYRKLLESSLIPRVVQENSRDCIDQAQEAAAKAISSVKSEMRLEISEANGSNQKTLISTHTEMIDALQASSVASAASLELFKQCDLAQCKNHTVDLTAAADAAARAFVTQAAEDAIAQAGRLCALETEERRRADRDRLDTTRSALDSMAASLSKQLEDTENKCETRLIDTESRLTAANVAEGRAARAAARAMFEGEKAERNAAVDRLKLMTEEVLKGTVLKLKDRTEALHKCAIETLNKQIKQECDQRTHMTNELVREFNTKRKEQNHRIEIASVLNGIVSRITDHNVEARLRYCRHEIEKKVPSNKKQNEHISKLKDRLRFEFLATRASINAGAAAAAAAADTITMRIDKEINFRLANERYHRAEISRINNLVKTNTKVQQNLNDKVHDIDQYAQTIVSTLEDHGIHLPDEDDDDDDDSQ